MAENIEQEARLIILRTLSEQVDFRLNSSLLRDDLAARWAINRSREWVHVQLGALAEIGAVAIIDSGSVRIAEITKRGLQHINREIVLDGVKRPGPEG
jgi:hypothetical protein